MGCKWRNQYVGFPTLQIWKTALTTFAQDVFAGFKVLCSAVTLCPTRSHTEKVWVPCGLTLQICGMLWDTARWKKSGKCPTTKNTWQKDYLFRKCSAPVLFSVLSFACLGRFYEWERCHTFSKRHWSSYDPQQHTCDQTVTVTLTVTSWLLCRPLRPSNPAPNNRTKTSCFDYHKGVFSRNNSEFSDNQPMNWLEPF